MQLSRQSEHGILFRIDEDLRLASESTIFKDAELSAYGENMREIL